MLASDTMTLPKPALSIGRMTSDEFIYPFSQISSSFCTKPPPQFLLPFFNHFHTLTDTRFPKRRPSDKPRRKHDTLRPSGPYAWVQHTARETILPNKPNQGSIKRRNEKKRMRQSDFLHYITSFDSYKYYMIESLWLAITKCVKTFSNVSSS